jgi:tRNA (adenine22-N1)-methyltransferase
MISRRLQAILDINKQSYDQVWDTCCDHGYLGEAYLQRNQAQIVHFVDRVPALMTQIEHRLNALDLSNIDGIASNSVNSNEHISWQVHCLDVKELEFASEQKHLVVVAGVGGDLCADIVEAIMKKNHAENIDWVFCPVHKHETLRKKLIRLGLNVVNESLVKDKGRIYEVIHVNQSDNTPASVIGQQIWHDNPELASEYLTQKIAHFERKANSSESDVITILAQLKAVADLLRYNS